MRDQKKATQTYKKCLEGNVWQMKEWKERMRNRENEEQTAYLKTLINKKAHPEKENSSIIYSTF